MLLLYFYFYCVIIVTKIVTNIVSFSLLDIECTEDVITNHLRCSNTI